ncbi:hypothetical protein NQZ68_034787 [Dissostichus eleginoides]|uniref:Anti-sigma-I factor RsgI1 n=1 Tax=Dissostichus eleginoides TaxID=100907 RepID=A0AAD9FCR6_DISEL|nr:hypothetical protein NQZ68_034787 [Dissostichus eleginoides]KAK1893915.1 Anti-sigma-I factor RsgI1 [Dissostichus eleginoides]
MVMTPGPGSGLSGPQLRHAEPRGEWTQQAVDSSLCPLNPSYQNSMALTFAATPGVPVENQTLPSHEPSGQTEIVPQETQVRKSEEEAGLSF